MMFKSSTNAFIEQGKEPTITKNLLPRPKSTLGDTKTPSFYHHFEISGGLCPAWQAGCCERCGIREAGGEHWLGTAKGWTKRQCWGQHPLQKRWANAGVKL